MPKGKPISSEIIELIGQLSKTDNLKVCEIAKRLKMDRRRKDHEPHLQEVIVVFVSICTIRRRFVEVGLKARRPAKKPFISAVNKKKRVAFAKAHVNWTTEDWKKILWSDKSKFEKVNQRCSMYVRRPINARFNPRYTKATVKFGSGNVMVWGCFSWFGAGPLYKVEGNLDQFQYRDVMEQIMLPFANESLLNEWIFQHDNDPKHTARTVKAWFASNN
eukprot:gene27186-32745_t